MLALGLRILAEQKIQDEAVMYGQQKASGVDAAKDRSEVSLPPRTVLLQAAWTWLWPLVLIRSHDAKSHDALRHACMQTDGAHKYKIRES